MTTTAQIGISVLSAPLAAIDRRSLSQAWYSALHLARDAAPPERVVRLRAQTQATPAFTRSVLPGSSRRSGASPASAKEARRAPARPGAALERRAPRLPLARRIERALFERTISAACTAFGVGEGAGRVVIALHVAGDRVRLIALCSATMRPTVARALDQARFALAARGIALDTRLLEGAATCS
jgi:hypothetical protein